MKEKKAVASLPTLEQLDGERKRIRRRKQYQKALLGTIQVLLLVAALAILSVTLFFPILQISGSSMEPTLSDGDLVVLWKTGRFQTGQLVGLNYSGKVLLKRVIAVPGDFVDLDEEGFVYINGKVLEEPYVTDRSRGDVSVELPCQVPESCLFVLGDHRSVSMDSRNAQIGCVRYDDIIGRILFRVWPLDKCGPVH